MLSLISTFFLGLFCCSGLVDYGLSCVSKDSNLIMNSNESLIYDDYRESSVSKDSKPSLYFGHTGSTDSYGNDFQLYMFKSDFCSDMFIMTFINRLSEVDPNFSLSSSTLTNYTWYRNGDNAYYGIGDIIYSADYNYTTNSHASLGSINFNKYYYNYDSVNDNYLVKYQLNFYNTSYTRFLYIDYFIAVDFKNNSGQSVGNLCSYFLTTDSSLAVWDTWYIVESTSTSLVCPFISYYYEGLVAKDYSNYDTGYNDGYASGYQTGYNIGLNEGINYDAQTASIFSGIIQVGLLPVNVFLTILNFEVFGINISGLVSSLLTVSIVIIVVRFIFGGKDDK